MGGIFGALQVSLKNLTNMQAAISVVNENVANANMPGYSRKRIVFEPGRYEQRPYGLIGTGAEIQQIESVRDIFVEKRILAETQTMGFFEGQQYGVIQLETVLGTTDGQGVPDELSKFFDAFLELASDPSSLSLRQVVLAQGDALARRIRSTMAQLDALEESNKTRIEDAVNEINGLLHQIAKINVKLQPMLNLGQDGGPLYDQRQLLLNQLAEKIDIQVQTDQSYNMILTTSSGRLLLMGTEVTELSVDRTATSVSVEYGGTDITSEIANGELGGLLEFQHTTLAAAKDGLNALARELVAAVNTVHSGGVDLDGNPGGDFFTAAAGEEARTIAVALTDRRLVAAAAPGAGIGDGTNAQALADIRDRRIASLDNQTLNEYYSQLVFEVGLAGRSVESNIQFQDRVLRQLETQRESVSGVSLDEEAVNLLQYQRSYQASARLIRVLDSLLEDTLNIVRT